MQLKVFVSKNMDGKSIGWVSVLYNYLYRLSCIIFQVVLKILNLTEHDSGIYSCELNNNNFNKFFDIHYFEALMSCLPDGHEHCCAAGINYQNNY